jgi:hypothetical protein
VNLRLIRARFGEARLGVSMFGTTVDCWICGIVRSIAPGSGLAWAWTGIATDTSKAKYAADAFRAFDRRPSFIAPISSKQFPGA